MIPPIAATRSPDHTRSAFSPRRLASRIASHAAATAATAYRTPYQWMLMGPIWNAIGLMNTARGFYPQSFRSRRARPYAHQSATGKVTLRMTTTERATLPLSQLVTLSTYWLGILHPSVRPRGGPPADGRGPGRQGNVRHRIGRHQRSGGHRVHPRPTHGRRDQRLHHHALGTPEAVHPHRRRVRHALPVRDRLLEHLRRAGRLLLPDPGFLELRPGSVPGLRAGPGAGPPGGHGERADGPDDRRGYGHRCRHRGPGREGGQFAVRRPRWHWVRWRSWPWSSS